MKEKDYHSIYEKYFNQYLEEYINEIQSFYKRSLKEGDAHDFVYDWCTSTLTGKRGELKINDEPFYRLYSIYKRRSELVQESNPNRLYLKHIIPAYEKLKIGLKEVEIEIYIEEIAISEASQTLYSWYSNWSTVYKMMFELKDLTEFKIIRNAAFSEGGEIFKKYHRELYPNHYAVEENLFDFEISAKYKAIFKNVYEDLTVSFIDEKRTSIEDFENVFLFKNKKHKSKIYFFCNTEVAAYLLWELNFAFKKLNFTNIEKSKLFISCTDRELKQKNLSNSKKSFINKIGEQEVDLLINEINHILQKVK